MKFYIKKYFKNLDRNISELTIDEIKNEIYLTLRKYDNTKKIPQTLFERLMYVIDNNIITIDDSGSSEYNGIIDMEKELDDITNIINKYNLDKKVIAKIETIRENAEREERGSSSGSKKTKLTKGSVIIK